jgi:hypothetical protein
MHHFHSIAVVTVTGLRGAFIIYFYYWFLISKKRGSSLLSKSKSPVLSKSPPVKPFFLAYVWVHHGPVISLLIPTEYVFAYSRMHREQCWYLSVFPSLLLFSFAFVSVL